MCVWKDCTTPYTNISHKTYIQELQTIIYTPQRPSFEHTTAMQHDLLTSLDADLARNIEGCGLIFRREVIMKPCGTIVYRINDRGYRVCIDIVIGLAGAGLLEQIPDHVVSEVTREFIHFCRPDMGG